MKNIVFKEHITVHQYCTARAVHHIKGVSNTVCVHRNVIFTSNQIKLNGHFVTI